MEALNRTFDFNRWELIYTEISQKYDLLDIAELAHLSGFELKQNFFDRKRYFVDSLWEKTKA
jgi:uncharacterized SAM-dependent methyltransferase